MNQALAAHAASGYGSNTDHPEKAHVDGSLLYKAHQYRRPSSRTVEQREAGRPEGPAQAEGHLGYPSPATYQIKSEL